MVAVRNFDAYKHAVESIRDIYGDKTYLKPKQLLKFGRNPNVGATKATVQQFSQAGTPEINETYVTTNLINRIVSSNDNDEHDIYIEGHSVDGSGNLTFVTQTVALDGQTGSPLTTALARMTRMYNADTTATAGTVYGYQSTSSVSSGVPQDNTKIHCLFDATEQNSLKASTSFSQSDYGVITTLYGSIGKNKTANAVVRFEVRNQGGVFRTQFTWELDNVGQGGFVFHPDPFILIPPNSDVRFTAVASTTDVIISAGFDAYLALIAS